AMGPLPSRKGLPDFDPIVTAEVAGDGYLRRTLTIVVEGNDRLPIDLYLPHPLADTPRPAMLALHPTGKLGKRIVGGDGPRTNRAYGIELAQRGYIVLCPDYPSFGDYPYDFNADNYQSGTMKGIFNHMRCVDYLQTLSMVDPQRIGVIGHSLGGHNAMFVAAFDERLKVIASSCGWTPFHDYYGGKIQGWTSDRYMPRLRDVYQLDPDRVPFDFQEVAASLAPRAFFSNSPLHDDNFAVTGVQQAIPRIAEIYRLLDTNPPTTESISKEPPLATTTALQVRYPKCDHDFPTEIRAEAYAFIDAALKHTPSQQLDYKAELPRLQPLEPEDALKSFHVQPGFEMQLVAAEPLVTDPVALSFDADGSLYVIEMRDYSEQETDKLGRVRLLRDTDGDGQYDTSDLFADGLSWPTAIHCWNGGVYVGAPPDIWYLKDTTGDHRADHIEKVYTGFGRSNVQGLMNSFQWGLDGRIHGATSSSGASVLRVDGIANTTEPLVLRGRDFAFDPRTRLMTAESGGGQHGLSFDDWGQKFVCSNSDHLQMILYEDRYLARNKYYVSPGPRVRIAVDGPQADVFRTSPVEPWRIVRTRLRVSGAVQGPVEGGGRAAGYFTGATGVTIHRGHASTPTPPLESLSGMAIIGDVGSNLVHRKRLTADGLLYQGTRIDPQSELVTSTDNWFRPVQFANGPDGALYILDMYREVIEHPKSLPPEIKQHLDLTSGRDRGRLYRLAPIGHRTTLPHWSTATVTELVDGLHSPNGWTRDTVSRLLIEQHATSAIPQLLDIVANGKSPQSRLHAIYLLDQLQGLSEPALLIALNDPHPRIRAHAIRLCEPPTFRHQPNRLIPSPLDSAAIRDRLFNLVDDPDPHVQYQLAFTLGELTGRRQQTALVTLIQQHPTDPWMTIALRSSLANSAGAVLTELASNTPFMTTPAGRQWIIDLSLQIAASPSPGDVVALINLLQSLDITNPQSAALKKQILQSLNLKPGSPLEEQIAAATGGENRRWLAETIAAARSNAINADAPLEDRIRSIAQLGLGEFAPSKELLASLLEPAIPPELQAAALNVLARYDLPESTSLMLDHWATLTPTSRRLAEEILLSRTTSARALLQRVADDSIPLTDLQPSRLRGLAQHTDAPTAKLAQTLLDRIGTAPRQKLVDSYRQALDLHGNPMIGKELFEKQCASCHRVGESGHAIGPNLTAAVTRGNDFLLTNILDPNREINPEFLNYTLVTKEGRVLTGIISAESATSLTLLRGESKTDSILRGDIDTLQSSGVSLMPEGLEKQLTPQQMADLFSFLKQSAQTP
ncbi:MAG: alpha/beta fold hydrolase, partial [Planctomycetaceae bacterium]